MIATCRRLLVFKRTIILKEQKEGAFNIFLTFSNEAVFNARHGKGII
jgi:hypothetical protein